MRAVFLQCRLDSKRLPAKALYLVARKPLVLHCMDALRQIKVDKYVLLCDHDSASVLKELAELGGFELFAGDKVNVLDRFLKAADHFKVDTIVRATADNPLVDPRAAQVCLDYQVFEDCDHVRMEDLPHGAGVEVVSTKALLKVWDRGPSDFEKEHVCPGVWQNPKDFKVAVLPSIYGKLGANENISVDTIEDYHRIKEFSRHSNDFSFTIFLTWRAQGGNE